jgi:hypothetical protein
MARAVYRGYWQGGKRSARVTRLHVIREGGKNPWLETWCGQAATQHKNSEPVIFDPMPAAPPEGLAWCPKCIGHLAERYGLLGDIAESLAAYDPKLYDDPEPRWARRRAARLAERPETAAAG